VHYRDCNDVKLRSIVCISEHLKHDTLAVHVFQKKLISYLWSELIPDIKKIYYFSDGSVTQFKNRKNFLNLCLCESEFGIKAEWYFYATAHGKVVCDGLGGERQVQVPIFWFNWHGMTRMYYGSHVQCVVFWQQWCHIFTKIPRVKMSKKVLRMTWWLLLAAQKWMCYIFVRTVNNTEKQRCLDTRTVMMIIHRAWG
jgi:hypothetical protein